MGILATGTLISSIFGIFIYALFGWKVIVTIYITAALLCWALAVRLSEGWIPFWHPLCWLTAILWPFLWLFMITGW